MGNAGSAHQLNLEDVNSEIHSYYKQQQMRRSLKHQQMLHQRCDNGNANSSAGHWSHSLPHTINNNTVAAAAYDGSIGDSAAAVTPNCKVLPKLNERLKLRTTTNGAILYSGGTISGKREQLPPTAATQGNSQKPHPLPGLQQRSRTFIVDDLNHTGWKYSKPTPQKEQYHRQSLPAFRRSQTLLRLTYEKEKQDDHINVDGRSKTAHNFRASPSATATTTMVESIKHHSREDGAVQANTLKLRKYNKKRKAPAAPPLSAVANGTSTKPQLNTANYTTTATNGNDALVEEKQTPSKSRLFRSNAKIPPPKMLGKVQDQQLEAQQHFLDAVTKSPPLCLKPVAGTTAKPYSYLRREKSSDAILLRHRNKLGEIINNSAPTAKAKLTATISAVVNANNSSPINLPNKLPPSKIPQLNRTFFFGMGAVSTEPANESGANITDNIDKKGAKVSSAAAVTEAAAFAAVAVAVNDYKSHTSVEAKSIMDNGLLIQVHPTLPRRQPNKPSFSPLAAWRMLVDEQHRQQQNCHDELKNCSRYEDNNNNWSQGLKTALLPCVNGSETDGVASTEIIEQVERELLGVAKEAPIQLTSDVNKRTPIQRSIVMTYPKAWTPQQDLGDDAEYDCEERNMANIENATDIYNNAGVHPTNVPQQNTKSHEVIGRSENNALKGRRQVGQGQAAGGTTGSTAGVHVFSLSLPRDGHTQPHYKLLHSGNTSSTLPKEPTRTADSMLKNSTFKTNFISPKCCCLYTSNGGLQHSLPLAVDELAAHESKCPLHDGSRYCFDNGGLLTYLSDNWVLHKVNCATNKPLTACRDLANESHGKWGTTVEPISLTYLTAGKHVMYLPGKEQNNNTGICGGAASTNTQKAQQQKYQQQQRRQRPAHQNLQDKLPIIGNLSSITADATIKDSAGLGTFVGNEKSQRFTFQSTIRLLEKRRLAERLVKDAQLREAQRKTELEAMNRVEKDFQRKRACEKANIRYQLQLYFSGEKFNDDGIVYNNEGTNCAEPLYLEHADSDLLIRSGKEKLDAGVGMHVLPQHDRNNNISSRADPDGAVSTPSPRCADAQALEIDNADTFNEMRHPCVSKAERCYDLNCGEESDTDVSELEIFEHSATLLKPYLDNHLI